MYCSACVPCSLVPRSVDDFGLGILLQTKQVKRMISSYVGTLSRPAPPHLRLISTLLCLLLQASGR
jgi:acyl CoA:acetate/3-ketoacid CoA transferase alpha subunit